MKTFGTSYLFINGKQVRLIAQAKSVRQFWLKLREVGICHCSYQSLKDYTSETHNKKELEVTKDGGIYYCEDQNYFRQDSEYVKWENEI